MHISTTTMQRGTVKIPLEKWAIHQDVYFSRKRVKKGTIFQGENNDTIFRVSSCE